VAINTDGNNPDPSAGLDVKFDNKGLLVPRMTRIQRTAIASPAEDLMVYCTKCGTNGSLSIFTNGSWLTFAPCTVTSPVSGTPAMSPGQIIWNWNSVPDATGYKWNTTDDYASAVEMGTTTTRSETGMICGASYTRYVWAYNSSF
jgi:hypothetical protein